MEELLWLYIMIDVSKWKIARTVLKHLALYSTNEFISCSDLVCFMSLVMSVICDFSVVGNVFDRWWSEVLYCLWFSHTFLCFKKTNLCSMWKREYKYI